MEVTISKIEELPLVVPQLLSFAAPFSFFLFEGAMASGKTTTIKALCAYLGVKETVSSPTFSLVNEYQSDKGIIYHFDFYRIKSIEEAFDIGYEEYFYSGAYCLVEWPEKIQNLLPEQYITVKIRENPDNSRTFTFVKTQQS